MTLHIENLESPVKFQAVIEDGDWDLLHRYLQYSEHLLASGLVQSGLPGSLRIAWKRDEPMIVESHLPPADDFAAFLHVLRPIYLQSEPTNFNRTCNLLGREFENKHFRSMLSELRDLYSGKFLQSMFQLSSNNVAINSDQVLSDWLNSNEYHRDQDKRERIDALHEMFPLDASKVIFLALLTEKVKAIASLATLVRLVLGKQKSLATNIRAKPNEGVVPSDDEPYESKT